MSSILHQMHKDQMEAMVKMSVEIPIKPVIYESGQKVQLQKLSCMFKELHKDVFVLDIERTDRVCDCIYVSIGDEAGYEIYARWFNGNTAEEAYEKYYPKIKALIDKHLLRNI